MLLAPYTVDSAMYFCLAGGGDAFLKTKNNVDPAEAINKLVVGDIILQMSIMKIYFLPQCSNSIMLVVI